MRGLVYFWGVQALRQYEIWWADLPGPAGERPLLLLSRDDAYDYLNRFLVAEITSSARDVPVELWVGTPEGLPKPCVVNLDNLNTVARRRLVRRMGALSSERHWEVKQALGYALRWEELIGAPG